MASVHSHAGICNTICNLYIHIHSLSIYSYVRKEAVNVYFMSIISLTYYVASSCANNTRTSAAKLLHVP